MHYNLLHTLWKTSLGDKVAVHETRTITTFCSFSLFQFNYVERRSNCYIHTYKIKNNEIDFFYGILLPSNRFLQQRLHRNLWNNLNIDRGSEINFWLVIIFLRMWRQCICLCDFPLSPTVFVQSILICVGCNYYL